MTKSLNVLVLESSPGAADDAIASLEDHGHSVHRCHEAGAAAFPCRSLAHDGCPLDSGTIDVALTMRSGDSSKVTGFEDGVSCALQQRIPLVVGGDVREHPYELFASKVVTNPADLANAVQTAASDALSHHGVLGANAAREVLTRRGVASPEVAVDVRRCGGDLKVVVTVATDVDRTTREMIAVRVQAVLSKYDRHARSIDVGVPI